MLRKNTHQSSSALVQIGIVSSGSGCAQIETPGVYIKTSGSPDFQKNSRHHHSETFCKNRFWHWLTNFFTEILTWISINTRDSSYCVNWACTVMFRLYLSTKILKIKCSSTQNSICELYVFSTLFSIREACLCIYCKYNECSFERKRKWLPVGFGTPIFRWGLIRRDFAQKVRLPLFNLRPINFNPGQYISEERSRHINERLRSEIDWI